MKRNNHYARTVRSWFALILLSLIFTASQGRSEENPPVRVDPLTFLPNTIGIAQVQQKEKKDAPAESKQDAKEKSKEKTKERKEEPKEDDEPPVLNLFARQPTAPGEAPQGRNPNMIGDFPGAFTVQTLYVQGVQTITSYQYVTFLQTVTQTTQVTSTVLVPVNTPPSTIVVNNPSSPGTTITVNVPGKVVSVPVTTTTPVTTTSLVPVTTKVLQTTQVPTTVATVVVIPQVGGGGPFKIGENEGIGPQDRVYLTSNYFNGLQGPPGAPNSSTSTQQTTINGEPASISTTTPGVPSPKFSLYRETLGFEKLILDGNSSIGLRVPLIQLIGGNYSTDAIGDLSVIYKRVLLGDANGSLISGGLVLTLPTGPALQTDAGDVRDVLIQPYLGGRYVSDRFATQGFVSLVVPTDSRDVTALFTDLSLLYKLYSGRPTDFLSYITPSVEAHLSTPLDHLTGMNPIVFPNLLTLTSGVHMGIYERTTFTLAVVTPVTGPRLFNVEAMGYLNYNF